jgi:transcriptional regulator with XRE-family HTH domain
LNTLESLRNRLESGGREYREAFVASQLKRGIPFQARALRKQRGWSQSRLAEESHLTQGVVSRALDPDYGNLTLNTILKIAAGFDVAFIGKFVPFSELGGWFLAQSEESVQVLSFDQDTGFMRRMGTKAEMALTACIQATQTGEPQRRLGNVVEISSSSRRYGLGGYNPQDRQGAASQPQASVGGAA